jgi:hypothetical protein
VNTHIEEFAVAADIEFDAMKKNLNIFINCDKNSSSNVTKVKDNLFEVGFSGNMIESVFPYETTLSL